MIDLGDWNERLAPLFADERYQKIRRFLIDEYNNYVVYPDKYDLVRKNWRRKGKQRKRSYRIISRERQ